MVPTFGISSRVKLTRRNSVDIKFLILNAPGIPKLLSYSNSMLKAVCLSPNVGKLLIAAFK